jgi:hypothetical protein
VTVRAVSGGASVLVTVLMTGSPPPSSSLTQEALIRRVDGNDVG